MPGFNRSLLLFALAFGSVSSAPADELDTLIYKMRGTTPPPAVLAPAPKVTPPVATTAKAEPDAPKPLKSVPTVTTPSPQALSILRPTPTPGTNAAVRTSKPTPIIALPPSNSPPARTAPPAYIPPPAYTPPPATQPPPDAFYPHTDNTGLYLAVRGMGASMTAKVDGEK